MGHIKFWQLSATFTGLKLQGKVGKFGTSELTDIVTFVQLPSGKVLSSSESGNLLLWDGGMVKYEISNKGKIPCHKGKIEFMCLMDSEIVTSGEDGYFRSWDLDSIDNSSEINIDDPSAALSPASHIRIVEMEPVEEILISKESQIVHIARYLGSAYQFLIQDQQGQVLKLDMQTRSVDKLFGFHSGPVASCATSPLSHKMASLGCDGSLRFHAYSSKSTIARANYHQGGSFIRYLPETLDNSGNTVAAGFRDGSLRIISESNNSTFLQFIYKPHLAAITDISISKDGTLLVTGSADQTIFLFSMERSKDMADAPFSRSSIKMTPLGFVDMGAPILYVSLSLEDNISKAPFIHDKQKLSVVGTRILVTLRDGLLLSGRIPPSRNFDSSITFEIAKEVLGMKKWSFEIPEKIVIDLPDEKNSAKKMADTKEAELISKKTLSINSLRVQQGVTLTSFSQIQAVSFISNGYFLAGALTSSNEWEIRLCHVLSPTFSKLLAIGLIAPCKINLNYTGSMVLIGYVDGSSSVIAFDLTEILSQTPTNEHETYAVYLDHFNIRSKATGHDIPWFTGQKWVGYGHDCIHGSISDIQTSFDNSYLITTAKDGGILVLRLNKNAFVNPLKYEGKLNEQISLIGVPEDNIDSKTYSIQESRMKSEKDREALIADGNRKQTRAYIQSLRAEYIRLIAMNPFVPLNEVSVDPYLEDSVSKMKKEKIRIQELELAWTTEKESLALEKLKRKFLDPLQQETITISAFRTSKAVSSFRILKFKTNVDFLMTPLIDTLTANDAIHNAPSKSDRQFHSGKNNHSDIKKAAASKLENRKKDRLRRAAAWKELMEAKPDDKYEPPKDIAAIRLAHANIGDYKLKSGDAYIVPESERTDADKKKSQVLLLRNSINTIKDVCISLRLELFQKSHGDTYNKRKNCDAVKRYFFSNSSNIGRVEAPSGTCNGI